MTVLKTSRRRPRRVTVFALPSWLLFEVVGRRHCGSVAVKPIRRTSCCDHLFSLTLWRRTPAGRTLGARRLRFWAPTS